MRIRELLRKGEAVLRGHGVENASYDARALFLSVSGMKETELLLSGGTEFPPDKEEAFLTLIQRRAERIPLQRILGEAGFYGRSFRVTDDVLVPRYDTETIVHEVLRDTADNAGLSVLDLCTGSGIIAITLKLERNDFTVTASDFSEKALLVAESNASRLRADVRFVRSDLFREIPERFDLIVSNPPYVRDGEIETLSPEVRAHEPRIALSGGPDGLSFYRRILSDAADHLTENGRIYLEIGSDQAESVSSILRENGFRGTEVIPDLSGSPRVLKAVRG